MINNNTESTAFDVAAAVYDACDIDLDWTDRPDGVEVLTLGNGCWIAIGYDDIGDGGISWAAYDRDGNPVDEGGWGRGQSDEIGHLIQVVLEWLAR